MPITVSICEANPSSYVCPLLKAILYASIVPVILDPVMVSTSGSLLLTDESIGDLIKHLLPLCTLLTPNLLEARQILSHATQQQDTTANGQDKGNLNTVEGLLLSARKLCLLGPQSALVKGGHQVLKLNALQQELVELGLISEGENEQGSRLLGAEVSYGKWDKSNVKIIRTDDEPYADILRHGSDRSSSEDRNVVLDVLYEKDSRSYTLFVKPHVQSTATHGTGCTLSSALAAHLASGTSISNSTHLAIQYVQRCISRGLSSLGKGPGPLNHLCNITPRPVLAPTAAGSERMPLCSHLIAHSLPYWRAFTHHSFLKQLVSHTLPRESFVYFLKQDYLFLKHYARVWASGASSFSIGNTFDRIATFAGIAAEMALEAENHVKICEPWGITRHDLDYETVESAATLAYTRFVLDVSRSGDALELLAATGPCLLGYGEAGLWMASEREKARKNEVHSPSSSSEAAGFEQWIDYYSGTDFQKVVRKGIENMEEYACTDPPSTARLEGLQRIWNA
jgi:hydroxymethylpyrimidine/phosphomethylpyrimidine kinase